jgi:3-deoxy-7-phosphoheptulonate synthase
MASGLSTPVGFKNSTDGSLDAAVNGILSASHAHSFPRHQRPGSVVHHPHAAATPYGHVVLRGGGGRPNYDTVSVSLAEKALTKAKLTGQHRRRLLPRQLVEEPRIPAPGDARRGPPDP